MPDPAITPGPEEPTADHAARPRRANVLLVAIVERPRGAATRHRVRNISSGGTRIDNAGGLRPGMTVSISIGAVRAEQATVMWVREELAGLAFAGRIDVDEARRTVTIAPGATVAPVRPVGENLPRAIPAPTAGWLGEMRDSYRR